MNGISLTLSVVGSLLIIPVTVLGLHFIIGVELHTRYSVTVRYKLSRRTVLDLQYKTHL